MLGRVLATLTAVAVVLAVSGCVVVPVDSGSGPGPAPADSGSGEAPQPDPSVYPHAGDGSEVLMLGRSVMRGWFDHWGYSGSGPVTVEGYALYYGEIAGPPDIATSAIEKISQVPDGTTVFFKLCFVDFEAYSADDVEARLAENAGYAEQVVAATRGRDITLILGNALPRVAGETTPELAELHEGYNRRLDELAQAEENVHVFDLYGNLATNGVLPKGLAVSPDDSHLNDVAYSVLDEAFFTQLDEIAKR